ncbi:MAG: hypothetical protein Q8M71_12050, partial [Thermodesulfovibrionales bacterium]|nr:hypothetical protein [Thermodesulfovibrionales bacterium]
MKHEETVDNGSIIGRGKVFFLRLNIAKKMLLGYLSLSILTVLISVFALSSLERINSINNSVIKTDVP